MPTITHNTNGSITISVTIPLKVSIVDRLNQHPRLRERMEALLNVVENVAGDCTLANDAEQCVIDELRKMGSDALHCWGDQAAVNSTEQLKEKQTELQGHGKKKCVGIPPSGK